MDSRRDQCQMLPFQNYKFTLSVVQCHYFHLLSAAAKPLALCMFHFPWKTYFCSSNMAPTLLTHWWRPSPTWQSQLVCWLVPYTSTSTVFDSNVRVVKQCCDDECPVLTNTHQDESTLDKPSKPAAFHLASEPKSRAREENTSTRLLLIVAFITTNIVHCLCNLPMTTFPQSLKNATGRKPPTTLKRKIPKQQKLI